MSLSSKTVVDDPEQVRHDEASEAAVRLASRAQMLGCMHAMAAHDFRDSLNSLTINIELLARTLEDEGSHERDPAIQQKCLRAMRQELKRLAQSTGGALEESRTGAVTGEVERIELGALVEAVKSVVRSSAQRQRVGVSFSPPAEEIAVIGQPDELRHAVFNLAMNALEAMPQGGELTFALATDGSEAIITVSDTGTGIPVEFHSRVWDLLFSTKRQGLGLGLHVVRNVAASHGGTATFHPREAGVTFTMRLPLVQ